MKHSLSKAFGLAAALFAASGAAAQTVEAGRLLYSACRSCHGADLTRPMTGPPLPDRVTYGFAPFSSTVRYGRPGTDMPGFGDRFTAEQICSLYLYVRSTQADAASRTAAVCGLPPPTPDAEPDRPPEGAAPPPRVSRGSVAEEINRSKTLFTPAPSARFPQTVRFLCRGGGATLLRFLPPRDADAASRWDMQIETSLAYRGFFNAAVEPGHCRVDDITLMSAAQSLSRSGHGLRLQWSSSARPALEHIRFEHPDILRIDAGVSLVGHVNPYADLLNAAASAESTFIIEALSEPLTDSSTFYRAHVNALVVGFARLTP